MEGFGEVLVGHVPLLAGATGEGEGLGRLAEGEDFG